MNFVSIITIALAISTILSSTAPAEILQNAKQSGPANDRAALQPGAGGFVPTSSMGYTTTTYKMVVYRMYIFPHVNKMEDKLGSWWSLVKPTGTKANYKAANAICFNWNN